MAREFEDPAGKKFLAEIRTLFESKQVFRRKENPIVFVCGGPVGPNSRTMRRLFLDWAKVQLPFLVLILAESAFRETLFHDPPETLNLASFESFIAEVSDGIVIFPESEGSFAEIGFFSAIKKIRSKTLIVNNIVYQASDSFINLGPRKTIDSKSFLEPTLHVSIDDPNPDFAPIRERLARLTDRRQRRKFQYKPYTKLDYLQKLSVVLEMVNFLRVVSLNGLRRSIRDVFGPVNPKTIRLLLAVLVAAGYIRRVEEYYKPGERKISFLEFEDVEVENFQARAVFYYKKYHPKIYELLRGT
jgi:hypothetical protein